MRYHKAAEISGPEASYLGSAPSISLNESGVVGLNGKWFDVRKLTPTELEAFLEDLLRSEMANHTAGREAPH